MPRKRLPPLPRRPIPYFDQHAKHVNGKHFTAEVLDWQEEAAEEFAAKRRKPGTRTAFRPHFPDMVYQLRLLGATNRMIAAACGVTTETINEWCHNTSGYGIPEFAQAMEEGGLLADGRMAASMFHRGIGYSHDEEKILVVDGTVTRVPTIKHYPPDTSAGVFWLTNRQKQFWRNRTTTELTGEDGAPLVPPQLIIRPIEPDNK